MENKPKFNFIDGIIVLLALLIVAGGGYYAASRSKAKNAAAANVGVEYKIELLERDKAVADKFLAAKESHDTVWVGEKERAAATIEDVEVRPSRKLTTDTVNGRVFWAENPEFYDVTVTLRSNGSEGENDIKADNTPIHVGEETSVKGKGYAGYGFITGLELVD